MANFLINNLFRIAVIILNYVSPSILADVLLHPFDFATVLLQIGYDPQGTKYQGATLMSIIVQYALFTFYIPYLLTSMQGLQFMGVPHPSIFYYVNYIYKKEGLIGCYRGLALKICERLTMIKVNEKVKQKLNKDSESAAVQNQDEWDQFLQALTNSVCAQFFAVVSSHPFHVIMVCSFAEFTCNKNSSILGITSSIYAADGCLGFFSGLTARMLGELLSLIFSMTYTNVINKQMRREEPPEENTEEETPNSDTAATVVNYVTDFSRPAKFIEEEMMEVPQGRDELGMNGNTSNLSAKYYTVFLNFLRNITHNSSGETDRGATETQNHQASPIAAYIPLSSKVFYYVIIRDYISKKISYPFFLVCNCAIVLNSGWEKFPVLGYLKPVHRFVQKHAKPRKNRRCRKTTPIRFNISYD